MKTTPLRRLRPDSLFFDYIGTLLEVSSWRFAKASALLLLCVLTEGAGLMLLIPLLQLVGLDVQQGVTGRIAGIITHAFAILGVPPTLTIVLLLYVFIVSSQALLSRWQAIANLSLQHELVKSLRVRLYEAVTRASWIFLMRSRSSDFQHILTLEIDRVGMGTYQLLSLLVNIITASVYLFLAIQISWAATALVLLCGLGLTLQLRGRVNAAHTAGKAVSSAANQICAASQEHLAAIKTTKSYGAEERNIALFSSLAEEVQQKYQFLGRNLAFSRATFEIGSVLILSLIFYISLEQLHMPLASLMILFFLFARLMPRFSIMHQSYQQFEGLLPAFASFRDTLQRLDAAAEQTSGPDELMKLEEGIRLKSVSFRFDECPIIDGLDLFIPAGQTVAIVGPSGAGKSTLADLVMGLLVPTEGRLLVDGLPLTQERIRSWRSQIGYVAQDTFLFNDTIKANLLWACPHASDADIDSALRLAAAEEFVMNLSQGLETILGDRGVRLSGGERQRLALARALLRRPSLLLLDEATSNLDSENERKIQSSIEQLHGSMTALIITHRLSTIRNADLIYVLEGGRLVESGSWDELMAKRGRFSALCSEQGVIANASHRDGYRSRAAPGDICALS